MKDGHLGVWSGDLSSRKLKVTKDSTQDLAVLREFKVWMSGMVVNAYIYDRAAIIRKLIPVVSGILSEFYDAI